MKSNATLTFHTGSGLGTAFVLVASTIALFAFFSELNWPAVAALGGLLWSVPQLKESFKIRLDPVARRFAIRHRTNWLKVASSEGSFDEVDGVRVAQETRTRIYTRWRRRHPHHGSLIGDFFLEDNESRRVVKHWQVWTIRIVFKNRTQSEPLLERPMRSEFATYLDAERLAKTLRVNLIDVTGPGSQVTAWNQLDVRLVEKVRKGAATPYSERMVLPPGSRIIVRGARGSMEIHMPAPGIGKMIPAVFFYAAMTGLVGFIVKTQNLQWGEGFLAGMIWFGILMFVPLLVFFTSREIIREAGAEFVFESRVFGIPIFRRRIRKHEIEEIELRVARRGFGCEVVIRSDRQMIRAGRSENEAEVLWLSEMLRGLLA